jgi:ElaA protein
MAMAAIKKEWAYMAELEPLSLHLLYELRTAIFVVEQNCAYQEVDGHDLKARHLLLWRQQELVACARVCPPDSVYQEPSIGRVAVKSKYRRLGLGRRAFQEALQECRRLYPRQEIKIQAQEYLETFYQSFGFTTISKPYLDFGISHVDMLLPWDKEERAS